MIFVPTYLYIKIHLVTGMLYFGKTIKADPVSYRGSGTRWLNHIDAHGRQHVHTLWTKLFDDEYELACFAFLFSIIYRIHESECWANLMMENGFDGRAPGHLHSEDSKAKMSASRTGVKMAPRSEEYKAKIIARQTGKVVSEETKIKTALSMTGRTHNEETKAKISAALKGQTIPDELKKKWSEMRKTPLSAEGRIFHSTQEAAEFYGKSVSTIQQRCRGSVYEDWFYLKDVNRSSY